MTHHWTQPEAVAARDREELRSLLRLLLRTWVIGFSLLGPLTMIAVHQLAPELVPRSLGGLTLVFLGYPAAFALQVFLTRRWLRPTRYQLDARGLCYQGGGNRCFYPWKRVQGYRLVDHPDVPGLRCLMFQVRGETASRSWAFDPASLDELELRATLRQFLPAVEPAP